MSRLDGNFKLERGFSMRGSSLVADGLGPEVSVDEMRVAGLKGK